MKLVVVAAVVVLAVLAVVGAIAAGALGPGEPEIVAPQESSPAPAADRDDRPLTPQQERRASAAALRVTKGGTVAELELSDDPGEAYEVEVIKGGREHDVALDAAFRPVPNRRYED
jgi:hypothetical protein